MRWSFWIWVSVALSCRTPVPATVQPPAGVRVGTAAGGRPVVALAPGDAGALELRTVDPEPAAASATPGVLAEADTRALLARLEPLPAETPGPVLRAPALTPPAAAAPAQPIAFVAAAGTPIADAPLSTPVARPAPLDEPAISPTNEVRTATEVTVRFDEPMVPIAAVGTVAPPIADIAPKVAGTWRWLDTRVASFTPAAGRFPAATGFTITVAAGVRAVDGSTLATAASATFATPAVAIRGTYPRGPLRIDAPIAIELDQDIDADAIQRLVRVEVKGKPLAIHGVALADARVLWAKNLALQPDAGNPGDHVVVVAPASAWPAGAELRVVLGKGAPSREGPRLSSAETDALVDVLEPFRVRGLSCGDADPPRLTGLVCPADGAVSVEFSQPLDTKSYRPDKVQLAGQPLDEHAPYTDSVWLSIPDVAGKPFEVAIADDVIDRYGQPLVGPRRATFVTTKPRVYESVTAARGLYVLDPRFEIPQWIVEAEAVAALHVELYAVQPADYFAFEAFEAGKRTAPPGKRVYDKLHAIGARSGAIARVDLRPALGSAGTGHVIAVATAAKSRATAWIQVTKLGVTARLDGDRANVWVHDIAPSTLLAPRAGVETALIADGRGATPAIATDADGHAAFELLPAVARKPDAKVPTALLVARAGQDSVFAAITGRHEQAIRRNDAHWYVTDDRFTYKPGESVYVKGWVRWTDSGVNPQLALPAATDEIAYTLVDRGDNKLASGIAKLTAQGGFDLEVKLPANAHLGTATFTFELRKETYTHPIAIEEFRTPTFALALDEDVGFAGARPVYAGESIAMLASAKYYSGGGLAGAAIKWSAAIAPSAYRPPNRDGFTFTPERPRSERPAYRAYRARRAAITGFRTASLDAASTSALAVDIAGLPHGEPGLLTVEATVTDLDRQTIRTSSHAIVVHPSAYYVGLRMAAGTADALEAIVTDVDGRAVTGVPIDVTIEGVAGHERDRDEAKVADTQHCKLASAAEPVRCAFTRHEEAPARGALAYTATARVRDARRREATAQVSLPWWAREDLEQDLAIVPDRAEYRAGDVARLEIRSAVVPATAVVSVARQGVIAQRRIELVKPSTTIELPIDATVISNVHVVVDRWSRHVDRPKLGALPVHASTERELRVDLDSARLAVTARPARSPVPPGGPATFEVEVRRDGKPVAGAEVALLAVDEAVLAASAKTHADPLAPFYFDVGDGTTVATSIDLVNDARDDVSKSPGFERWSLDGRVRGGRGGMRGRTAAVPSVSIGSPMAMGKRITARKDFRATAVWSPRLATDANGRATVTVAMPDSLTRFRIVALATAATRYFGKAESTIVTQRAVNARIAAPRFLTQGDRFALPIVVQNLGAGPRTIDVAVRAANLDTLGPAGRRVTLAAGQRAELRFDVATRARGRAVIQVIAVSGDTADASTIELPVYEPATTEAFATYGVVDDSPVREQLAVPADVWPEVGGVEVELASTQLASLTDAFWYLQTYPHECAEQRSSRMLATSAMADLLEAFAAPGRPARAELEATRAHDLEVLGNDQHATGGWGYWHDSPVDPYVSIQVLAALSAARPRPRAFAGARAYVVALADHRLAHLETLAKQAPGDRGPADRAAAPYDVALVAAALGSLATAGTDARPRAERLHAAATALGVYPFDARARVLALVARVPRDQAIRAKLLAELVATIHETAAGASVAPSYTEAERPLLVSANKSTALVLDALIREAPAHPLIPKLARGLLDARRRGRWLSTQENLAVLQAMRRYFDTYEKAPPRFTGALWFGRAGFAEQAFAGRTPATFASRLDWTTLPPRSTHDLTLQRTGTGRMYYRIGITYAPKEPNLPALDAGFVVRRAYEAVDDPGDVVHLADGRWQIKLGARVLVRLETITTARRFGVALVDPLPAGFEPVTARLAMSERVADGSVDRAWDHTNQRDDRSEAYASELADGSHHYAYTVRATTPGSFLAAPAKAEEMYSPETFGRSTGAVVIIR